ncbi:MAG: aminodeoxychorismate synthase component I [Candidatus Electronema sp. V4]|uniref:aminodeoxychorismate synthase component I n=1 Tax=Candidatus Electronema sp. V4 TaxID=3454756 RepID=UPI00405548D9
MKPFSDADILRLSSWLVQQDDFVFLESSRVTAENCRSFLFLNPLRQLICRSGDDASAFLNQVDQFRRQGFYLTGWLDYEFGCLLEPRLRRFLSDDRRPLAVFGVYEEPLIFDHQTGLCSGGAWPGAVDAAEDSFVCSDLQTSICREEYLRAIEKIQDYIRAGDTYQVNFTLHFNFAFHGSAAAFYRALRRNQSVCYSAWIRHHGLDILSFSPELFFRADAEKVRVRPMKGTLRRGRTNAEDEERRRRLQADPKNRSENVMIVDLLRNDLGRLLHESGGGQVPPRALFEVETYESLLQMTSTIDGIPAGAVPSFRQIIEALFPCGSVTGAPKIRTMEIIRELERQRRGVYCGAVGFTSQQESCFNVPIRTVALAHGRGRMGIGSGIVADSKPEEEWAECLLKGNFLTKNEPNFQLIETLLWQPESGFFLLDYHLERLADSARYFHFSCDLEEVRSRLTAAVAQRSERLRVRLLLYRDGRIDISSVFLPDEPPPAELPKVIFSQEWVDPADPHRFHKTTRRELYDRERGRAVAQGFYEVLFVNTAGQVTEGSISNIFVRLEKDGPLFTPPVESGLLAGTFRRMLLEQGEAAERELTAEDVLAASEMYLGNSVRGLVRVQLV